MLENHLEQGSQELGASLGSDTTCKLIGQSGTMAWLLGQGASGSQISSVFSCPFPSPGSHGVP